MCYIRGLDANKPHHSAIFVFQKVTMIHKGTDGIRASEIHAQPHTRIFQHPAVEERDVDGISQKGLIDRNAGPIQQQKVNLVNVECV
jgi:hypothetical protein